MAPGENHPRLPCSQASFFSLFIHLNAGRGEFLHCPPPALQGEGILSPAKVGAGLVGKGNNRKCHCRWHLGGMQLFSAADTGKFLAGLQLWLLGDFSARSCCGTWNFTALARREPQILSFQERKKSHLGFFPPGW